MVWGFTDKEFYELSKGLFFLLVAVVLIHFGFHFYYTETYIEWAWLRFVGLAMVGWFWRIGK